MPPPGVAAHRPLQHASPDVQGSPSTRQASSSRHVATPPSSRLPQVRPQQSSAFMHGSPAGRQSGTFAHRPIMQTPPQQSLAAAHEAPAAAHIAPPHAPAAQPSAQHAPARLQLCPSDAQPAGLTHTRAPEPAGSGRQANDSHSAPVAQSAPSARRTAGAHWPAAQLPEQHSPAAAHGPPFAAQARSGDARGTVSSTRLRQAIATVASAPQTTTVASARVTARRGP